MESPEAQIANIIDRTLNDLGNDIVGDIREEIGDGWPPASDPLSPPHLRTGELQRSVNYTVTHEGSIWTLTITADIYYAGYLEWGTDRAVARPFMTPALERWTEPVVARLQEAFDGNGAVVTSSGTYGMAA